MPDEYDNIKGSGWTRKRAEGWERVFGARRDDSATQQPSPATMEHPRAKETE